MTPRAPARMLSRAVASSPLRTTKPGRAGGEQLAHARQLGHRLLDPDDARQRATGAPRWPAACRPPCARARCRARPACRPRPVRRRRSAGTAPPASGGCTPVSRAAARRWAAAPSQRDPRHRAGGAAGAGAGDDRHAAARLRAGARVSSRSSASLSVADSPVVPPTTMPLVPLCRVKLEQPRPGVEVDAAVGAHGRDDGNQAA